MTNTVTKTAPERIWLQVSDGRHDACEPFPSDTSEVTWCRHKIGGCEVEYVRADLAAEKCNALTDAALARDEIFTLLREDRDSWRRVAERLQNDGNALQQDYEREAFRETPKAQPVQPKEQS